MSLSQSQEIPALQRLADYQAAITKIAEHVGAVCGGIDAEDDDPNSTANAIITKIDHLIIHKQP